MEVFLVFTVLEENIHYISEHRYILPMGTYVLHL
jgi:hypothetical protein